MCIFDQCSDTRPLAGDCQEDADCAGSIGVCWTCTCAVVNSLSILYSPTQCSSGQCGASSANCNLNIDCDAAAGLSCISSICRSIQALGGDCDVNDGDDCVTGVDCRYDYFPLGPLYCRLTDAQLAYVLHVDSFFHSVDGICGGVGAGKE